MHVLIACVFGVGVFKLSLQDRLTNPQNFGVVHKNRHDTIKRGQKEDDTLNKMIAGQVRSVGLIYRAGGGGGRRMRDGRCVAIENTGPPQDPHRI